MPDSPAGLPERFPMTHWSLVAQAAQEDRREALGRLLEQYLPALRRTWFTASGCRRTGPTICSRSSRPGRSSKRTWLPPPTGSWASSSNSRNRGGPDIGRMADLKGHILEPARPFQNQLERPDWRVIWF